MLAGVAQLVERDLPKVDVEGSRPFSRSQERTRLLHRVFSFVAEILDKATADAHAGVVFRNVLPLHPGRDLDFAFLYLERRVAIEFRRESGYQRVAERPRLAAEILDVLYVDSRLFHDFAVDRLFQGFSDFDESGNQEQPAFVGMVQVPRHEQFVCIVYGDNHDGRNSRVDRVVAMGADHGALFFAPFHGVSAVSAELVQRFPVRNVECDGTSEPFKPIAESAEDSVRYKLVVAGNGRIVFGIVQEVCASVYRNQVMARKFREILDSRDCVVVRVLFQEYLVVADTDEIIVGRGVLCAERVVQLVWGDFVNHVPQFRKLGTCENLVPAVLLRQEQQTVDETEHLVLVGELVVGAFDDSPADSDAYLRMLHEGQLGD